jgi:magnesium transporter
MRELLVRQKDGACRLDVPFSDISDLITDPDVVIWLDIYDPDDSDIALLRDEFRFHPLAIEDAIHYTQRAKIDTYHGFYFIVFYAAYYDQEADRIETQELDLFVGRNFLVSVHQGKMRQVSETIKRWQAPDFPLQGNIVALVYTLLDTIVDEYFPLIDRLADRIDELEDDIFINFDEEAIQTIFQLKKDLLMLRRSLAPERDVLNVLLRREIPVYTQQDILYFQDVYDHVVRVLDSIDTYRDLLSSALDSYLSLQSNRLNQIVKVLTITSIILMANALVAGIYGMNFEFMPELRWPWGYPLALGLMVTISGGLVMFFRHKKWI